MEKLAEVGHTDPTYQLMIYHTEQQTDNKFLEENSELKKVGVVRKELGLFQCQNGRKLVVRNSKEIVIPQQARKEMLMELHSTHMSSDGMKRLERGKFYCLRCQRTLRKYTRLVKHAKRMLSPRTTSLVRGSKSSLLPWRQEALGSCSVQISANMDAPTYSS